MHKTIALTLVAATLPVALADETHGDVSRPHKVTICHATHSANNPYVLVTVGGPAERAHEGHQDDRDVSAHTDLGLPSGPTDGQPCEEDAGGGPNPI